MYKRPAPHCGFRLRARWAEIRWFEESAAIRLSSPHNTVAQTTLASCCAWAPGQGCVASLNAVRDRCCNSESEGYQMSRTVQSARPSRLLQAPAKSQVLLVSYMPLGLEIDRQHINTTRRRSG